MNILDEIALQRGCRNCIALTFNFDIAWFEALVYQRLITAGVRRILVITDTAELSATLERQGGSIHRAGIDFSIIGINVPGCFHPKAVFLSGQDIARLYVGSGNLTSSGFGRNLEVFERLEVTKGDSKIPPAFEQFRKYLEELFLNHFDVVPMSIERIMTHAFGVDILTLPKASGLQVQLLGSPNELFARLDIPNQPAENLVMLAPYFDPKGEMVLDLVERFDANQFTVITDRRRTNLCTNAAAAIRSAGGVIQFLKTENERPLHAKIVFGKGQDWSLGLSGSANLSKAAWYGHNAELVAVRRDDLANDLESLLNGLTVRDATEAELEELGQFRPVEDELRDKESSVNYSVVTAKWIGSYQIKLNLNRPISLHGIKVEFLTPNGSGFAKEVVESEKDSRLIVTPCSLMKRGRSAFGRIHQNGVAGPWFVVEDPRKLAEHAKARRRLDEFAQDLLFGNDLENPPEKLLKFLSKIFQKRNERLKKAMDNSEYDDKEETDKEPNRIEWAWVKEEEFGTLEDLSSNDLSLYQTTGGRLRLINLLLFGSEAPINADNTEGESELDETLNATHRTFREEKKKETRIDKERKHAGLSEILSKARESYLDQLRRGDHESYPLGRTVEDMLVLCAGIHSAFESGYISQTEYRTEIQSTLLAFLGNPNAPFIKALSKVPEENRLEEWEETPLLLLICLLLYNFSLSYSEGEKIQTAEATLWFRYLLPSAPRYHVSYVISDFDRQLPMLKNGVFWLQDALGSQIELNPFQNFIRDLVSSTYSILELEKALPIIETSLMSAHDLVEDDKVVHQFTEGQLKVGFAEETGHPQGHLQVWLRENPFDLILPSIGSTHLARPRGSINSVVPFCNLLSCVAEAKIQNADEAISILRKLADS